MIRIIWSRRIFAINAILLSVFSSLIAGVFVWAVSGRGFVSTLKDHYFIVICSIILWFFTFAIEVYRSRWEKTKEDELERKLANRDKEVKIEMGVLYRQTVADSLKKSFNLFVRMVERKSYKKVNLHIFWFQEHPNGGRLYKIRELSIEAENLPGGHYLDYLDLKRHDYFATCQAFLHKNEIYLDLMENPPEYQNDDKTLVDPAQRWVLAMPICASNTDQQPYGVLVFFGRQEFYKNDKDRAWFIELAYLLTQLIKGMQENSPDGKGLIARYAT